MRRLLVVLLVGASLAAPSAASAQTMLHGYITSEGSIALCTTDPCGGNTVTQLPAGTYSFMIHDTATLHNFDLIGTSVQTGLDDTGTFIFDNVTIGNATYTYQCDAHPDINGSFTGGSGGSPPPLIDTAPPNTRIASGPPARTRAATATFRLRSTEPGSKFQCKLDRGSWRACRATKTYRNVRRGLHSFQARAIDAAGNRDPTPAKRTWRRL